MPQNGTVLIDGRNQANWPAHTKEQERCNRRATGVIVRPLTKMEKCSVVQAVVAKPARGSAFLPHEDKCELTIVEAGRTLVRLWIPVDST